MDVVCIKLCQKREKKIIDINRQRMVFETIITHIIIILFNCFHINRIGFHSQTADNWKH